MALWLLVLVAGSRTILALLVLLP